MKNSIRYIIVILAISISSCASESNQIEELIKPKTENYQFFGVDINGQITYQFYHEYGFTDKIYQWITIIKTDSIPTLRYNLPLNDSILKKLKKINLEKFIPNKPIIFNGDYKVNADITTKAEQYYLKDSDLNVGHKNGSYSIEIHEELEIIRIYDSDKGIEYIEMRR